VKERTERAEKTFPDIDVSSISIDKDGLLVALTGDGDTSMANRGAETPVCTIPFAGTARYFESSPSLNELFQ